MKKKQIEIPKIREIILVSFLFPVFFFVKICKAIAIKFQCLAECSYRQTFSNEKNGIVKGERVEIFCVLFAKNTTRTLRSSKRFYVPLLRQQEVVFWCHLFRKKGEGLKGFGVDFLKIMVRYSTFSVARWRDKTLGEPSFCTRQCQNTEKVTLPK